MKNKKCPYCSKKNEFKAIQCKYCGKKILKISLFKKILYIFGLIFLIGGFSKFPGDFFVSLNSIILGGALLLVLFSHTKLIKRIKEKESSLFFEISSLLVVLFITIWFWIVITKENINEESIKIIHDIPLYALPFIIYTPMYIYYNIKFYKK